VKLTRVAAGRGAGGRWLAWLPPAEMLRTRRRIEIGAYVTAITPPVIDPPNE